MKIKYLILIAATLLLASCGDTNPNSNKSDCVPELMPDYDYRGTVSEGEMTPEVESYLRIEKRRDVFKPCRTHRFDTEFLSKDGHLISKEEISFTPTGKRWEPQPEKQDEISIEYNYQKGSIDSIKSFQLNRGRLSDHWQRKVTTGIIENVEEIWMHPFRSNQYNFTQVAPFPQVQLPIKIGKTWTDNNIILNETFGDWSNMKIRSRFEVLSKETIETKYGTIEDCYKIESTATFKLGESTLLYWFHPELGFIKMNYTNYGDQKLNIELIEIKDNL